MSVLVKGMEMPKNCYRCPLDLGEWRPEQDPHIYCRYTKKAIPYSDVPTDRRLDCCGLEDVPPHGRLIDADACAEYFENQAQDEWNKNVGTTWSNAYLGLGAYIEEDAPTIIEAEGGHE